MSTALIHRPRRSVSIDPRDVIRIETARLATVGLPPADHAQQRMIASVSRFGVMQPLLIRAERDTKHPRFFVIDGRRRLYAAIACGINSLPCLLEELPDEDEPDLPNAYRRLSGDCFAQADLLADRLNRCMFTQQELADRLGISQSAIANKLRLRKLDVDMRAEILKHGLSERHARALVSLPASDRQKLLAQILRDRLTVAEAEEAAEKIRAERHPLPTAQKGAIRDIGFFYNSIDRAVSLLQSLGIAARVVRDELPGEIRLHIHIPHNVSRETLHEGEEKD